MNVRWSLLKMSLRETVRAVFIGQVSMPVSQREGYEAWPAVSIVEVSMSSIADICQVICAFVVSL